MYKDYDQAMESQSSETAIQCLEKIIGLQCNPLHSLTNRKKLSKAKTKYPLSTSSKDCHSPLISMIRTNTRRPCRSLKA